MTKRPRLCPRCGELLKRSDAVCPSCGTSIEVQKKGDDFAKEENLREKRNERIEAQVVLSENMSKAKREQLEKEAAKKRTQGSIKEEKDIADSMSNSKRKKLERDRKKTNKAKAQHKKPVLESVSVDANGKTDINVSDVSFFTEEEKRKNAGKKYKMPEKLKWYDIFRWADRWLARRKVKRVVNKAATEIPERVNKWTMLSLCIFFGYMGAHSLYSRNWTRALVVMGSFVVTVVLCSIPQVQAYGMRSDSVMHIIIAPLALIFLITWIFDLVRIIFNRFRYRESRNKFIETLNFDTRAILGKRYIKKEIAEMKAQEQEINEQNS